MAKKVQGTHVEHKVTTKGLKEVGRDAKKAGKGFDTLDKNARSADRGMKGAANMSSGASKNFSKLSQGITGGLVPAYATLAANLFALDAVFRFLKDSADFRVLTQGQLAFAAATGVAYQTLARDLQAATNNMINFRDAAQAGAIGRAAGLSAGQLRELAEAARTVSIALGRDVTDSFNRLVRGVTKAEPELLDELGIVLRLEEATTKYAAALGLNKNQLSIYQKSQAVVVEVLDQAERKFGKINEIMEINDNSISQLGIAFQEAIDNLRPFIAGFAEFFAKFGKNNIDVLTFAIIGFAGGIIKSVIPATHELRAAEKARSEAFIAEQDRIKLKLEEVRQKKLQLANTPIAQQNFGLFAQQQGLAFGGKTGELLASGEALSGQQIGNLKSQLSRGVGGFKNLNKKQLGIAEKLLDDMKKDGGKMSKATRLRLEELGLGFDELKLKGKKGIDSVVSGFERMAGGAMRALSVISTIVAVGSILFMIGKSIYNFIRRDEIKRTEQFNEKLEQAAASSERLNKELAQMGKVVQKGLVQGAERDIFVGNAAESADIENRLNALDDLRTQADLNKKGFNEFNQELITTFRSLERITPEFKVFAEELARTGKLSDKSRESLRELQESLFTVKAAQEALKETTGELVKAQNRLVQGLPKVPYQDIIELLETQQRAYKDLVKEGKPYENHLQLVADKLEMMTLFQQMALDLSIRQQVLSRQGALGFLAGAGSANRQLNVEKARLKLAQETRKANDLALNIQMSELANDSTRLRSLKNQAELQAEMVANAKVLVEVEKIRADMMAMTVNNLYQGLEKDLGQAIGAGLRGEDDAFKKIGENLAKGMTDAIGQMLAEQFLEDIMPDFLKPASLKDEIMDAGEKHALDVKSAILTGAQFHGELLETHNDTLKTLVARMEKTQLEVFKSERESLKEEEERAREKRNKLEKKISAPAIADYRKSPEFQKDADEFMIDSMNSATYTKFMATIQNRAALANLQAAGQIGTQVVMQDGVFAGYSVGQTLEEFQRMRFMQQYGNSNSRVAEGGFEAFAKRETALMETYEREFNRMFEAQGNYLANEQAPSRASFLEGSAEKYIDFLDSNIQMHLEQYRTAEDEYQKVVAKQKLTQTQIENIEGKPTPPEAPIGSYESFMQRNFPDVGGGVSLPDAATLSSNAARMIHFDPKTGDTVISTPNLAGRINEQLGIPNDPLDRTTNTITSLTGDDEEGGFTLDQFSKNINQFSGVIGMMGALTGEEEKTAKIMAAAAKIQLMVAIYQRAQMALNEGSGFFGVLGKFFLGEGTARQGGIMSKHGRSYAHGGIADGPNSGYGAILHGREAVVPLPNGRAIPVEMAGGGKMNTNNTNITVNIDETGATGKVDSEGGAELGVAIQGVVQAELERQMRPGGLLGS